jgi:hypothetical protein
MLLRGARHEALHAIPGSEASVARAQAAGDGPADAGVTNLGEAALATSVTMSMPAASVQHISLEMPRKPFKGQRQPPCGRGESELRGGCWIELKARAPDCKEYAYELDGSCYMPVSALARPDTSQKAAR